MYHLCLCCESAWIETYQERARERRGVGRRGKQGGKDLSNFLSSDHRVFLWHTKYFGPPNGNKMGFIHPPVECHVRESHLHLLPSHVLLLLTVCISKIKPPDIDKIRLSSSDQHAGASRVDRTCDKTAYLPTYLPSVTTWRSYSLTTAQKASFSCLVHRYSVGGNSKDIGHHTVAPSDLTTPSNQ